MRVESGLGERVVREGVPHRCHLSRRRCENSHIDPLGKDIAGNGNCKCKSPEAGEGLGLEECRGASASGVRGARVEVVAEGGEERAEGQARSGRHRMTLVLACGSWEKLAEGFVQDTTRSDLHSGAT